MSSNPPLSKVLVLVAFVGVAGCGSVSLVADGGKADASGGHGGNGASTGEGGTTGGGGVGGGGATSGSGGATGGAGGKTTGVAGATGGGGVTGAAGATGGSGGATTGAGGSGVTDGGSDDGTTDAPKSDTITLRLTVPADQSFCDMTVGCDLPPHITIMPAADKAPYVLAEPECATTCSSCQATLCTGIACLSRAVTYTGSEIMWDRSIYTTSTCGTGTSCYAARKVVAGRYIAHMCATPGTISTPDGGLARATCTPSGAERCIDVPFDIPGPSPVEGKLP